jgi:hypothetical protein
MSAILSDFKQFCWKHKAKIGISAIIVVGGAALYYYYSDAEKTEDPPDSNSSRVVAPVVANDIENDLKVDHSKHANEDQLEESRMLLAVNELFGFSIIYFSPSIRTHIKDVIDVSDTIKKLKELKNNISDEGREIKIALWNDVKLAAISSLFTTIYSLSAASVLLQVQMHILVCDAASSSSSGKYTNPFFFPSSHFLCFFLDQQQPDEDIFQSLMDGSYSTFYNSGISGLAHMVKAVVSTYSANWNVGNQMNVEYDDLADAFQEMRTALEGDLRTIVMILLLRKDELHLLRFILCLYIRMLSLPPLPYVMHS